MDENSLEHGTHSFIVKVWRERTSSRDRTFSWRGYITHVPDGERRSVRHLEEIGLFISHYLRQMGARPGWRYRLLRLTYALGRRRRRG